MPHRRRHYAQTTRAYTATGVESNPEYTRGLRKRRPFFLPRWNERASTQFNHGRTDTDGHEYQAVAVAAEFAQ